MHFRPAIFAANTGAEEQAEQTQEVRLEPLIMASAGWNMEGVSM